MQLILASASKGREYLLKQLKIPFEIMHTNLDEEKIVGKSPPETVQLRAKLKGEEIASGLQRSLLRSLKGKNFIILTADTEVILDNQLIGKPKDYKDAVRMLKMLSGRTHEVISAFYIIRHSGERSDSRIDSGQARMTFKIWQGFDRSFVAFRKLTDEDIRIYLSLTEYTRYTGSYALIACPQCLHQTIQKMINPKKHFTSHCRYLPYVGGMHGRRASPQNFITKIEGSISNVIGLPMEKVIPILRLNELLR